MRPGELDAVLGRQPVRKLHGAAPLSVGSPSGAAIRRAAGSGWVAQGLRPWRGRHGALISTTGGDVQPMTEGEQILVVLPKRCPW